jgi:hypothetical protein
MAHLPGRPIPHGGMTFRAGLVGVDYRSHPQNNLAPRTVRPINYSPLGPSTLHTNSPFKRRK